MISRCAGMQRPPLNRNLSGDADEDRAAAVLVIQNAAARFADPRFRLMLNDFALLFMIMMLMFKMRLLLNFMHVFKLMLNFMHLKLLLLMMMLILMDFLTLFATGFVKY